MRQSATKPGRKRASNTYFKQNDVTVAYRIIAAFDPIMAGFPRMTDRALFYEVFTVDRFRLDESALEVGVDDARCPYRRIPCADRPRPDFFVIKREKSPQPEHSISAMNETHKPGFLDPEFFQILPRLGGRKVGQVTFELGA